MHHITSVVSYLIALEQHGQDEVSSYIGTEPSGKCFDSLELKDDVLPHNPLISSGILTCCSLLYQDETIDRKYEMYAKIVQKLIGGSKVDFCNEMFLSEIARSDRNYCLLYMLKEAKTLPQNSDVKQIMQFYTQT
jgi:glutaminase